MEVPGVSAIVHVVATRPVWPGEGQRQACGAARARMQPRSSEFDEALWKCFKQSSTGDAQKYSTCITHNDLSNVCKYRGEGKTETRQSGACAGVQRVRTSCAPSAPC